VTADDRWPRETAAVRRALDAWPFEVAAIELLSVSENLVFRVDRVTGGPVVARLHRSGYNSLVELESEHAWVSAINQSSSIAAARPIETSEGRSHVAVDVAAGDTRFVGVVDWVGGQTLGHILDGEVSSAETVEWYRRAGGLLGQVHNQAAEWKRPSWFQRRAWDVDGMVGPDPEWGRFWAVPLADPGQREVLAGTRDSLRDVLSEFGTATDRYGLIHADLYCENMFVADDELVMIDFDDAGFGWHLYDIAVAVYDQARAPWFPDVRDAIVDGYRESRPLPADHEALLSTFLLMRSLALLGWLVDRPELDPTGTRVERDLIAAVNHCTTFLSGADPFG
jgi:Ser/Thr protein kinase RdoA (MazF antagonist)